MICNGIPTRCIYPPLPPYQVLSNPPCLSLSPILNRTPQLIPPSQAIRLTEGKKFPQTRYLKRIDHISHTHISAYLTPTSTRFLLLHLPHPPNTAPVPPPQSSTSYSPYGPYTNAFPGTTFNPSSSLSASSTPTTTSNTRILSTSTSNAGGGSGGIPNNPTSPQTEEAIRLFFTEVNEVWLKSVMSPFGGPLEKVGSPVFRARVVAAGRKYL